MSDADIKSLLFQSKLSILQARSSSVRPCNEKDENEEPLDELADIGDNGSMVLYGLVGK